MRTPGVPSDGSARRALPAPTANAESTRLHCGAAGGAGNPAPRSPRAPRGPPRCRPGSARLCPAWPRASYGAARRGRGSGRAIRPAHAQFRAPDPQRPPQSAALPSTQGGRTHRGAGAGGGAGGRRALHRDQSHRGAAAEPPVRPAGALLHGGRGGGGGGRGERRWRGAGRRGQQLHARRRPLAD